MPWPPRSPDWDKSIHFAPSSVDSYTVGRQNSFRQLALGDRFATTREIEEEGTPDEEIQKDFCF